MQDVGVPHGLQATKPAPSRVFSLLEILTLLWHHWRLLGFVPLATGAAALLVTFMMTPLYTASTVILPAAQQQNAASALLNSLGGVAAAVGSGLGKNSLEQWVGLLKSRTIADALIAQHQLKARYEVEYQFQAREKLDARTDISQGKDGLITVAVTDADPAMAMQLANGYANELQKLSWALVAAEAAQRRRFFEGQLKEVKDKLTQAEIALQSGGFSEQVIKNSPQAVIESMSRLRAQVAAAEVRLDTMRGSMTQDNPSLRLAARELASLRAQLALAQTREQTMATQSDQGSTYVARLRDFKYYETLFELLARQYEFAKADETRNSSSIQVVDSAVMPEWKSSPQRGVIAVLAALAALVLTIVAVLFRALIRTGPAP